MESGTGEGGSKNVPGKNPLLVPQPMEETAKRRAPISTRGHRNILVGKKREIEGAEAPVRHSTVHLFERRLERGCSERQERGGRDYKTAARRILKKG